MNDVHYKASCVNTTVCTCKSDLWIVNPNSYSLYKPIIKLTHLRLCHQKLRFVFSLKILFVMEHFTAHYLLPKDTVLLTPMQICWGAAQIN